MPIADYRNRIRKLLALAESSNENEARTAMLKARELMAKYKLSESDVKDSDPQNVVTVLTEITCSGRRNPWCIALAAVISKYYCCVSYRNAEKGKQTYTCGFIGFDTDVAVCIEIFKFACDCVQAEIKRIKQKYAHCTAAQIKSRCDSFGWGFALGLSEAFDKQNNEQKWGLVLVTPQEVRDVADNVGKPSSFRSRSLSRIEADEYAQGYQQGREFSPHRYIART